VFIRTRNALRVGKAICHLLVKLGKAVHREKHNSDLKLNTDLLPFNSVLFSISAERTWRYLYEIWQLIRSVRRFKSRRNLESATTGSNLGLVGGTGLGNTHGPFSQLRLLRTQFLLYVLSQRHLERSSPVELTAHGWERWLSGRIISPPRDTKRL
jgi:hypothetical protein